MKRIAIVLLLLSSPALAQQPPPQTPEDTIAAQNQTIGQLYFQVGTLQQQLSRANSTIADLNAQIKKLTPTTPPDAKQ